MEMVSVYLRMPIIIAPRSAVPRKHSPESTIDSVHVDGSWGIRGYPLRGQTRPHHLDVAHSEVTTDEGPVGLEKAQHTADDDIRVGHSTGDLLDLRLNSVDEFGLVATAHSKRLDTRPEDPAFDAQFGTFPLVPFRVDHPHPRGRDDDVVDVRPRTRDPAVMKNTHSAREILGSLGQQLLADGTALPSASALGIIR